MGLRSTLICLRMSEKNSMPPVSSSLRVMKGWTSERYIWAFSTGLVPFVRASSICLSRVLRDSNICGNAA